MVIKKKQKFFDVRIPRMNSVTFEKLRKSAEMNKRTMAGEAEFIIENFFKNKEDK